MWQLLVAPPAQTSTLVRAFAGRDVQSKVKITRDPPKTIIQRTKSFPMLGHYSHGTVHSFLAASEGTEYTRTWRLPTPTKVADKLKSSLLGEMASAEWEVLEKKEWDNIPEAPLQSVHESSANREDEKDELNISNIEPSENNCAEPESPKEPVMDLITIQDYTRSTQKWMNSQGGSGMTWKSLVSFRESQSTTIRNALTTLVGSLT
ncbi:unnamed protein product [Aspergillus oryzae]|uniref:Unnamed protein product n=2 Tax=Aspergillus oryzae TaxID=5062 RepID=A0AAN4YZ81_ASPOZ|nr:unnamed protein product [Aspergillus oryzae]GMF83695.1 unnamed protein product [Aspergillus oryzae]GMG16082.1 unnamed protein product [Aspergillus oryzae]GMG37222.1 unnamed protein product [Aspergillus oryzae]GMG52094.1 unnamed protein product [Aspergillus oryzae var. brunneus]